MLVLDTNHLSELTFNTTAGSRLLNRLEKSSSNLAITAITVEESLRGWLAEIRRFSTPRDQVPAYQRLLRQVDVLASWVVLPWDNDSSEQFERHGHLRRSVGTQDLKIACICLAYDATLLTRNLKDFLFSVDLRARHSQSPSP